MKFMLSITLPDDNPGTYKDILNVIADSINDFGTQTNGTLAIVEPETTWMILSADNVRSIGQWKVRA